MQKIKICGITQERELDKLIELKVDYGGFVVFYPKSRRNNNIEQASKLIKYVKEKKKAGKEVISLKTVAVMVSPDIEQLKAAEAAGFDILQIHGKLNEEVKNESHLPIWKAFNLSSYEDIPSYEDIASYEDIDMVAGSLKKIVSDDKISGIVFDGASYGGGEAFMWEAHKNININDKLFILAGGLTPENVGEAIRILKPHVADVSSGVEYDDKSIAGKDFEKLKSFVDAVRSC